MQINTDFEKICTIIGHEYSYYFNGVIICECVGTVITLFLLEDVNCIIGKLARVFVSEVH